MDPIITYIIVFFVSILILVTPFIILYIQNDTVDTGVSKFLMHGSVKQGRDPYELTYILDEGNNISKTTLTSKETLSL